MEQYFVILRGDEHIQTKPLIVDKEELTDLADFCLIVGINLEVVGYK